MAKNTPKSSSGGSSKKPPPKPNEKVAPPKEPVLNPVGDDDEIGKP